MKDVDRFCLHLFTKVAPTQIEKESSRDFKEKSHPTLEVNEKIVKGEVRSFISSVFFLSKEKMPTSKEFLLFAPVKDVGRFCLHLFTRDIQSILSFFSLGSRSGAIESLCSLRSCKHSYILVEYN